MAALDGGVILIAVLSWGTPPPQDSPADTPRPWQCAPAPKGPDRIWHGQARVGALASGVGPRRHPPQAVHQGYGAVQAV